MTAIREAKVVWKGDLMTGEGAISAVSSQVFENLPVTWASRSEAPGGKTSPEELLAAAHASCFAMALSNGLAKNKTPPERLEVSARVTFAKTETGWKVTRSELSVVGLVPDLDEAGFRQAAETAKEGCPVSQALKGNMELSVDARLAYEVVDLNT